MISVLIHGTLTRAPQSRTDKNGKTIAIGVLRSNGRDGAGFVSFVAFEESVVTTLLKLREADVLAISGELTVSVHTGKSGTPKPSLDVVVHGIVTLAETVTP
jgi:single-stranded DNA-binding protein